MIASPERRTSRPGLAVGTPVAAPFLAGRPELLGPDERAAATTRLPGALIHITPATWTKITSSRLLGPPFVRLEQLLAPLDNAPQVSDLADLPTRVNSVKEEQLRSIKGPETGEIPLIEQCLPNRTVGLRSNAPDSLVQVPVRPEEVRPKMPHNSVLGGCRNEFDDGQPVSDCIMITGREHGADLERWSAAPVASPRVDLPHSVHPEVGMQCELVAESEQLVLTARDHLAYADTCQIGGCQRGHAELGPGQHAAGEDFIEPLAGPPDGISLGHGLIVPCGSTS